MQKREKILAGIAGAAVMVWLVLPGLSTFFFGPIEQSRQRLSAVNAQLTEETRKAVELKQAGQKLKRWEARSLPPNPLDAQRLYQVWLTDVAQMAGLSDLSVTPGRRASHGKVYTAVLVSLDAKATLADLSRFLYAFNRIDLAHRIVVLTIQPTGSSGDPPLNISLTAEAMAFSNAASRSELFPQTKLARDFAPGNEPETIAVTDCEGFPKQPGFRIRIGNEYLAVTHLSGTEWTVRGGIDGTPTRSHAAGDVVALSPVHPEFATRTLADYQELVTRSPFVKPTPPPPTATESVAVTPKDDSPEQTYLAASILENEVPQAWLYRRSSNSGRIVLHKGSELAVGDIQGVVLDIAPEFVLLQQGDVVWKLRLGDNLRSMEKVSSPTDSPSGSGPVPAFPAAENTPSGSRSPVKATKPLSSSQVP